MLPRRRLSTPARIGAEIVKKWQLADEASAVPVTC